MSLCQGRWSILDYAIELRTLAANSGSNNAALIDTFLSGLSPTIKDQLISLDLPDNALLWPARTHPRHLPN